MAKLERCGICGEIGRIIVSIQLKSGDLFLICEGCWEGVDEMDSWIFQKKLGDNE